MRRSPWWTLPVVVALLSVLVLPAVARPFPHPGWPVAGQNVEDTRNAADERTVTPGTAATLAPKWTFTGSGNFFATPTVAGNTVYSPDSGGMLWAIDAGTGVAKWGRSISSYTGIAGDTTRTSPAIDGRQLIVGTKTDVQGPAQGAFLLGIDAATGNLNWKTVLDPHPYAQVTGSAVVLGGVAYIGVSSREYMYDREIECCSFRGSVVAVSTATGQVLWRTFTVPEGYSGAAVWGVPALDARRGLVYVGTGNNYTVPPGVCTRPDELNCTAPVPDDYVDSVIALEVRTGHVLWGRHTLNGDAFTFACTNPGVTCGPDFDFGSGANLYSAGGRDLVGIGQKGGTFYALDRSTGGTVWSTQVGPGSVKGGFVWGSATDGHRIYVGNSNGLHQTSTITLADGGQVTVTGGFWAALDAATGAILWVTPEPQGKITPGFVSAGGGLVFGPSEANPGTNMYALDARTGAIKWQFASGGAVVGGAAIVDGVVYWGAGYPLGDCQPLPSCGQNNKLYAFAPSGR